MCENVANTLGSNKTTRDPTGRVTVLVAQGECWDSAAGGVLEPCTTPSTEEMETYILQLHRSKDKTQAGFTYEIYSILLLIFKETKTKNDCLQSLSPDSHSTSDCYLRLGRAEGHTWGWTPLGKYTLTLAWPRGAGVSKRALGRRDGHQEAGRRPAAPNWAQVCTMAEAPQGRTWS